MQKEITVKFEVLIIHSSHFPSKRAYVTSPWPRGWGGEIENSTSLVLHVHIQRKRQIDSQPNHCMADLHTLEY